MMEITYFRITNWQSFADTDNIRLGKINVLVGRNNSGKSAILRAILLLQQERYRSDSVRLDEPNSEITISFGGTDLQAGVLRHYGRGDLPSGASEIVLLTKLEGSRIPGEITLNTPTRSFAVFGDSYTPPAIPNIEPRNFIYPYLSKRKVQGFGQQIDRNRTNIVTETLENLIPKIDRLVSPDYIGAAEYADLCTRVLGFRVGTYASENGKQAGITVGRFNQIPIEDMGEGVSSMLGLITNLCMSDGNLFLIEEPENDIHPESLKALLNVIVEKSATNQFIVTTHSNIVTRYLGAAPTSKLFVVESTFVPSTVPTSTIREVENTPTARIEVLRDLGYELSDFDLWDGWLILEESSAELIIRYLIPWFVPRLARIRTVAAGGTSKVEPTFEDFRRLFLFAHLEPQYRNRAWVVVDGDDSGTAVVTQLQGKYKDWPASHFRSWQKNNFEEYYPDNFEDAAKAALALPRDKKRAAKAQLTKLVDEWCRSNPDEARAAFELSAAEIIAVLREIDLALFGK